MKPEDIDHEAVGFTEKNQVESERRRRMLRRLATTLAFVFAVLFVSAGCLTPRNGHDLKALGLEYRLRELNDPRPNRVHILRVDFAKGRLQPAVVIAADPDGSGPAEAALTDPLKLADDRSVLAFVNANPWDSFPDTAGKRDQSWFEGQPVDIQGLAVSGSQVRSPGGADGASVWVDERGRVCLGDVPGGAAVVEGMAGFQQVVRDGAVVVPPGGPQHPRTAVGVNQIGTKMWLVVVDGRQPGFSEGMTLHELAGIMRDMGCWNATNLDGGGSSVMGLVEKDGPLRVVNSPSGRSSRSRPELRPVPMILTLRKEASAP